MSVTRYILDSALWSVATKPARYLQLRGQSKLSHSVPYYPEGPLCRCSIPDNLALIIQHCEALQLTPAPVLDQSRFNLHIAEIKMAISSHLRPSGSLIIRNIKRDITGLQADLARDRNIALNQRIQSQVCVAFTRFWARNFLTTICTRPCFAKG